MRRGIFKKSRNWLKAFIRSDSFKHFLCFLALLTVAYMGFLNQTIISDNITGRMERYDSENIIEFMNEGATAINGRWGNITYYLVHKPLSLLGFNYIHNQWVYFAIDITVFAIALTVTYEVFQKLINRKKAKLPLFFAIALMAVNAFMVDGASFLIPSHPQAMLCTALVLYFITSKRRYRYLIASIFALGAIVTYQSYYAPILILGTLAIYIQNKDKLNKQFAVNLAKLFGITGASVIIQLLSTKIYCKLAGIGEAKSTSFTLSISKNLQKLYKAWESASGYLARGFGIYHLQNILIIVLVLLLVFIAIAIIHQHNYSKIPFNIIFICAAIIIPILYTIAADNVYFAARILVGYFTVIAAIAILAIYQTPKDWNYPILAYGLAIFVAINVFHIASLITDIQISNRVEMAELRLIQNRIENYESQSEQEITKVYVYNADYGIRDFSKLNTNHPDNTYYSSHQLLAAPWSDVNSLNRVMGRNFERIQMSEATFKEKFPNHEQTDMKYFDPDERLAFDKGVLYWIAY